MALIYLPSAPFRLGYSLVRGTYPLFRDQIYVSSSDRRQIPSTTPSGFGAAEARLSKYAYSHGADSLARSFCDNNYNMKSGAKGQHGISLVSRHRTLEAPRAHPSKGSPAKQPAILQRKRSSECLAIKKKPIIKTQPAEQEEFRLEVRHTTLYEETEAIQDLLGGRRRQAGRSEGVPNYAAADNSSTTRNSSKHQLRNSSAPRLPTAPSQTCGHSPQKTFESTDRRLGEGLSTLRKTFRVDINLGEVLRQHNSKHLQLQSNTEIENIFAKGIRKKLQDIEKSIVGAYPTPTFRQRLVETNLDALQGKLKVDANCSSRVSGKENIVVR